MAACGVAVLPLVRSFITRLRYILFVCSSFSDFTHRTHGHARLARDPYGCMSWLYGRDAKKPYYTMLQPGDCTLRSLHTARSGAAACSVYAPNLSSWQHATPP